MRRLLLFITLAAACAASAAHGADNHVVIITIDGCAAYFLTDPQAPLPTFPRAETWDSADNASPRAERARQRGPPKEGSGEEPQAGRRCTHGV